MTPAAPRRSLREDQRGAILVAAVFMATFMVGCLWYVMGIGDAILYRQRMQDGADAVAYAGAVYHARGMNIIAMLNLVMAAILAVLVWLKIAQVLLWSLIAILVGLCFFGGWACGAIPTVKNIESQVQTAIDKVEPIVDKWLKALSKLQGYVAKTTPYVAGGRSVMAAQEYDPTVEFGLGVSVSMKPQGDRLGLPVQEDEFDVLCEKAGTIAAQVSPLGLLSAAGVPGADLVAGMVGSLVATFPGYFCDEDGSSGAAADFKEQMAENALKQCKAAKKAADEADEDNDFDVDECYEKALEELDKSGAGAAMNGSEKTPKRVFYAASNGDRFFQVHGLVLGDTFFTQGDKGVELAAWEKSEVRTASVALTRLGTAQAEFYYDQVRPGRLDWDDYEEDAMWNMRWRARLRRVRLTGGLGSLVESSLPDWIPNLPGNFSGLQDQLEGAIGGFATDQIDEMMNQNLGDGTTPELVGKMVGAVGEAKVIH